MTTADTHARTPEPAGRFRLPDIPEREPDEVTQFDQLFRTGLSHALAVHLGNPETTLVEADRWIVVAPGTFRELARYPDLLVAFGVDPAIYEANNGYVVSGEPIATLESERAARMQEREARMQEREARVTAEAARDTAEDRIRELEALLRRQSS